MKELAAKLELWIKEQVTSAGCRGTVLGLSGGIDSTVVAILCQRAFPQTTLSVIMPCHSSSSDMEDAELVASKFALPFTIVDLTQVYDLLLRVLPQDIPGADNLKMAQANLKPRLRMTTLYYIANRLRYLVAGTGNRSELTVGYFTKYGDGGVDILPIGNLVKSQVWELARYFGVPHRIIEKPPSAGLWAGQTDEQEIGLSYQELDRYIVTGQGDDSARQRVDFLASSSAHKKRTPPIPPF